MDEQRFDDIARGFVAGASRRALLQWLAGGLLGMAGVRRTLAQDGDTRITAGHGGQATADATGGAVSTGTITTGENRGTSIVVGDSSGGVVIDGGDVASTTRVDATVDGGAAVADAAGGSGNAALIERTEVTEDELPTVIPPKEPQVPDEPVVPPAPPPPTCVPQDEACTRGGMACCAGSECITGDSARGFCRAICGEETTRCNDTCIPFCEINVPNPGACAGCACRPGQLTCTLGTEYTNPNTCCLADQECCRVGPLGDPTTYNICCAADACFPGLGCGV